MVLHIKYMVSSRCKIMIQQELKRLGVKHAIVELGIVEINGEITPQKFEQIKLNLNKLGFELLEDNKSIIIEKVKTLIIDFIHYSDNLPTTNYSEYISENLNLDYTYISNIFSEVKGMTIQQFIINNRIERAKELLMYNQLNLTEISHKLHYSSVAHLSNQFKKVTGLTPTEFKQLKKKKRIPHENI